MVTQEVALPDSDAPDIFARARLRRAEIIEEYGVSQEISENSWHRLGREQGGRIELEIPYDGHRYFTRDACRDVARALTAHPRAEPSAIIGHLLLGNYERTSLGDGLSLAERHGAIPIEVPVRSAPAEPGQPDPMSADRHTCVMTYPFDPGRPKMIPVRMEVGLFDSDSSGLLPLPLRSKDGRSSGDVIDSILQTGLGRRYVSAVLSRIREQPRFSDGLYLRAAVRLDVPAPPGSKPPEATIAKMALNWPTVTSMRTVQLLRIPASGLMLGTGDGVSAEQPRYNPVDKCIEWTGTRLSLTGSHPGRDGYWHYESEQMVLVFRQPGDLYVQSALALNAEITIPQYLLSGMDARIYDATGYVLKDAVTATTKVTAQAQVRLKGAFTRREFSPNQHLFFDEIVPDEGRVADVRTALEDRGFSVRQAWASPAATDGDAPAIMSWLLVAHRQVGPDDMVMWILVDGRTYDTERETAVRGGQQTLTTTLQSGEIRIFVRGTLPGDSSELTHEINALHKTLRDEWCRVRQHR
jgi:hypothetical protein